MSERPMAQEHQWEDGRSNGPNRYRFVVRQTEHGGIQWEGLDYKPDGWEAAPTLGAELLRVVAERNEALEGEQVALRQRDQFERERDAALARCQELEAERDALAEQCCEMGVEINQAREEREIAEGHLQDGIEACRVNDAHVRDLEAERDRLKALVGKQREALLGLARDPEIHHLESLDYAVAVAEKVLADPSGAEALREWEGLRTAHDACHALLERISLALGCLPSVFHDGDAYDHVLRRAEELRERLTAWPKCGICGEHLATCFGSGENNPACYGCDECCGHGNEDGWCVPLSEIPEQFNDRVSLAENAAERQEGRIATLEARCRAMVSKVRETADHPTYRSVLLQGLAASLEEIAKDAPGPYEVREDPLTGEPLYRRRRAEAAPAPEVVEPDCPALIPGDPSTCPLDDCDGCPAAPRGEE